MLRIEFSAQFKRDYKLAKKRGLDVQKLVDVMTLLQNKTPLPEKYRAAAAIKSSINLFGPNFERSLSVIFFFLPAMNFTS